MITSKEASLMGVTLACRIQRHRMTSKGKKAAPSGGKGKKAPGFGKGSAAPNPMATFEDDDMYQEPIKKVCVLSAA